VTILTLSTAGSFSATSLIILALALRKSYKDSTTQEVFTGLTNANVQIFGSPFPHSLHPDIKRYIISRVLNIPMEIERKPLDYFILLTRRIHI
jgi:hypothetical protein